MTAKVTRLHLALALVFLTVAFLTTTVELLHSRPRPKPLTVTKTVTVVKTVRQPLTIAVVRAWMLQQPIANAWIGKVGAAGRADCFATQVMGDGFSTFAYCKIGGRL